MSAQPGITATGVPYSSTATPSPSSSHSALSPAGSSGGRPCGCLVWAAGLLGGWPVVGDPGRRDRAAGVMHVGGRGRAVVLDHHPAAAVGALAVEQYRGLGRPAGTSGYPRRTGPFAQRRHSTAIYRL